MDKYNKEKNDIIKCARWLSARGYFGALTGTGGNVSTIDRQDNIVLITPSNRSWENITPDDICVIDSNLKSIGGAEPSCNEIAMHASVYNLRPDVTAVIHTHAVYPSVFSVLNKPIPALFDEITYEIGPVVEIAPYAMPGSPEFVANISAKLHNKCYCYILQNHGALCLGSNMAKALKNAELLERVAQIYYYALTTGLEITRLPESSVKQLIKMRNLK